MATVKDRPNRPYELVAYDNMWPKLFESYSSSVRSALGNNVIRIEHIGSTSLLIGMEFEPLVSMSSAKEIRKHKECWDFVTICGLAPRL